MTNKIIVLIVALYFVFIPDGISQTGKPQTSLKIRNAFEDPTETANPAKVSFTSPDTGHKSYLINLGITYQMLWQRKPSDTTLLRQLFKPFIVINRNSMIDEEQYNYKAGLDYEVDFGRNSANRQLMHVISLTAQYLINIIDTNKSFVSTLYWTILSSSTKHPNQLFINNYHRIGSSTLFYNLTPGVGIELQDLYKAVKDSTGFQLRLYAKPSGSVALRLPSRNDRKNGFTNPYEWHKKLELSISYVIRENIINSVRNSPDFMPQFTPSLTFYPVESPDLSLSFSYSSGADPIAALHKQKFFQLALQFQL